MSLSYRTSRIEAKLHPSPLPGSLSIEAFRGDPLLVPVRLYEGNVFANMSNVTGLTLLVKAAADSPTALITQTKTVFTADDGSATGSVCVFSFTNLQMNLAGATQELNEYWATLYATDADGKRTIANGRLVMAYDGDPTEIGDAPVNPDFSITSDQANARYARKDAAAALNLTQMWQILNNIGMEWDATRSGILFDTPTGDQAFIQCTAPP